MKITLRSEKKQEAKLEMLGVCFCGGGDSAPAPAPAPTTQTVTQTTIPEWARPYAENVMSKAQALTDISQNPYVAYTGQRVADFNPLQQQAFAGAAALGPSPVTGEVAQRGLAAGAYDPYQTGQFTGQVAQQYMNPYVQNVMDIEKREAQRQSDILGTQQQAAAVQRGAYGGSRDAIMRAERERNLTQQMGDIQAKGLQQAYNIGQGQFNTEHQLREQSRQFGAGLGLQGLQTALQGAGAEFQQGIDASKLQQLYGTQQFQRQQDILSQQYQDFLNQQNYPYKQLGFLSDIVRGTGQLSQQGSSSVYQAPPSLTSQLTGLGTAAVGLSGLAKNLASGGEVGAGLSDLALSRMG